MTNTWRDVELDDGEDHKGDGDLIARIVERSDLKKRRGEEIIVGPKEAAVIIKDGKVEDIVTQTKLEELHKGILDFINPFSSDEHIRVLFVDTTPIEVTGSIPDVATKDNVSQDGTVMIRFQADMNAPQKFLNLLKNKKSITTDELMDKIKEEIDATVFSPHVSKYTVDDFKGSTEVQDDIEEAVMTDMRKTFDMLGLEVLNLSIKWHLNKYEEVARKEKSADLEEREEDIGAEREVREIERDKRVEAAELEGEQSLDWKEIRYQREKEVDGVETEEEKKDIRSEHTVDRESRQWEQDKQELKDALDLKKRLDEQKMKKQDSSGALVNEEDGANISADESSSSEGDGVCPSCGKSVEKDWNNCPDCGEEL